MKKLMMAILIFNSCIVELMCMTKKEARLQYRLAATSEKYCEKLISDLQAYNEKTEPLLGA
jgi:hypothetical protein